MQAQITFYQLNSQWLEIDGLADGLSPTAYKDSASLSATLYDNGGSAVAGATNLSLQFVTGSNGVYRALIPNSFNPRVGPIYTLKIDAVDSFGNSAHFELPCSIAARTD